jgi:hypothetical protein
LSVKSLGKFLHIFAASGGGDGTRKKSGPDDPRTVNNPYSTSQRQHGHIRGGPIPIGRYVIEPPKAWHHTRAARLQPLVSAHRFTVATGRDGGFLIHGAGPLGSDGCIVPKVLSQFNELMDGLAADGRGILTVLEARGGSRFA